MENEKIENIEPISEEIEPIASSSEEAIVPVEKTPPVPAKKPRARRKTKKVVESSASGAVAETVVPETSGASTGIIVGLFVFLAAILVIGGSIYAYMKVKKIYLNPVAEKLQGFSNPPSSGISVEPADTGETSEASPEEQMFGQSGNIEDNGALETETENGSQESDGTDEEADDNESDEENQESDDTDEDEDEEDIVQRRELVDPYDFDSMIHEMDVQINATNHENFNSDAFNDAEVGL